MAGSSLAGSLLLAAGGELRRVHLGVNGLAEKHVARKRLGRQASGLHQLASLVVEEIQRLGTIYVRHATSWPGCDLLHGSKAFVRASPTNVEASRVDSGIALRTVGHRHRGKTTRPAPHQGTDLVDMQISRRN